MSPLIFLYKFVIIVLIVWSLVRIAQKNGTSQTIEINDEYVVAALVTTLLVVLAIVM